MDGLAINLKLSLWQIYITIAREDNLSLAKQNEAKLSKDNVRPISLQLSAIGLYIMLELYFIGHQNTAIVFDNNLQAVFYPPDISPFWQPERPPADRQRLAGVDSVSGVT